MSEFIDNTYQGQKDSILEVSFNNILRVGIVTDGSLLPVSFESLTGFRESDVAL